MKVLVFLLSFLALASAGVASPYLVCDPSPQVVGGGYEIWEITPAYPGGRLAYSDKADPDGSIKMDLNNVPVGIHNWKARYYQGATYSEFTFCSLTVSLLYYKSVVKTFKYYSVNKGWVLKVLEK